MKFIATFIAFATLLIGLAIPVKADEYANFFDDANCSVNGGQGVSIDNPGCLSEPGRGSVYIPNWVFGQGNYCLVTTPSSTACNCQSNGFNFQPTGFCHQLNPSDQSYRFVGGQQCDPNNC